MTDTANLGLPLIEAAQAQKHVTHNEALRILDTLVQLAVLDRDFATPPGSPAEGQRWLVAAGPTGAWTGHAKHIAFWQDGMWQFCVPKIGWLVYVADEGALIAWTGTTWVDAISALTSLNNMTLLGVGTMADVTNPFSAKLNNALWVAKTVAQGGDGNLRYKMSKEAAANTLSLLLQDNFSGRAEIGLTGDDDLHVKVSADGTIWRDALVVDRLTGKVVFSQGMADPTALGRASLAINGDHIVSQQYGDAALTGLGSAGGTDSYVTDQWRIRAKGSLRVSAQRISSLSLPGVKYALRTTVTTTQSTLGSGDYLQVTQPIEGLRCLKLGFGASGANALAVGLYIRASVTGTFCVFIANAARTRSIVKTVAYAAANAWQWVSFSGAPGAGATAFAGDTTGTWLTDTGVGLHIGISLAAGSALQGTADAWTGSEITATAAQTSLPATASATFDVTALCAFAGLDVPPAERAALVMRPYDEELQSARRYFEILANDVLSGNGSTNNHVYWFFKTTKRVAPAFVDGGTSGYAALTINADFMDAYGGGGASQAYFRANSLADARL